MSAVRCAIYTRKSSDEGLEQDFNSLDAQREACAAYILSQASEGWELLPAHYDDGGISGGTLERPALKRLMADVAADKIDIIVIYKIDRLTRSLLDFAKLVEVFEKAGTSFVSVTQSFNTTTSMGRLTLNMLLSFAQFEREVTAERIRDKLAASKAKGMWMGGVPPLGYKPAGRSLAIIEKHAAIIRDIYERYLKLGNVRLVQQQLAGEGINTPLRKTLSGRSLGGRPFSRGNLYAILKNPIYAGDIPHRGKVAPGNHKAIIARDLWNAVQQKLAEQTNGGSGPKQRGRSPLAGLLRDADGEPLLASHTSKGGKRYRYYVSKSAHLGEATGMRIPAEEIEQAVANRLAALFGDPLFLAQQAQLDMAPEKLPSMVERCKMLASEVQEQSLGGHASMLSRVEVHDHGLVISVSTEALGRELNVPLLAGVGKALKLNVDLRLTKTGRAIRLVQDNGEFAGTKSPDLPLLQLVARARRWWGILREEDITPTELARREKVTDSYVSRVLRVAFLSPRVIDAVLAGQQRADVTASFLLRPDAIPADWQKQETRFLSGRISQRADPNTA